MALNPNSPEGIAKQTNGPWGGYDTYEQYAANNGIPVDSGYVDPLFAATGSIAGQAVDEPTGDNPYGGGGTPAPTFQQYFNGQLFTDAGEYTNAVTQAITKSFNDANAQIQKAYDLGLLDIGQKEEMIKNNRKKALSSIQASFASLSPEATQSEQFSSELGANKEQDTNQANLNLYKTQMGDEYANNLTSNQQSMQQNLDTTLNNTLEAAPDANYANSINLQAPTLSNNVGTAYSNVAGVAGQGNPVATKQMISGADVPQNIKDFLYANFVPNK